MCVLRDTYLIDDPAYREEFVPEKKEEKKHLHLVTAEEVKVEIREEIKVTTTWNGAQQNAWYWCRTCQTKVVAVSCVSCDCGVTMCTECWTGWDHTCPMCDSSVR